MPPLTITATSTLGYGLRNNQWKVAVNGSRVGPPVSEDSAQVIVEWLKSVRTLQQIEFFRLIPAIDAD